MKQLTHIWKKSLVRARQRGGAQEKRNINGVDHKKGEQKKYEANMDAKSLVDIALFTKMETMTLGQRRLIPGHKIAARVFAWLLPIKPVPSRLHTHTHKKNFSFIPTPLLVLQYNSQAEIALPWHKDASFPVCGFWVLKLTVASQLAPTQTMSVID